MKENKLTYMLSKLTPEQRDDLIGRLGISRSTFYERRGKPGDFTLDQATTVCRFLEAICGEDLDIYHLLNTQLDVMAEKSA